jgi:hypothetical protein
MHPGLEPLQVGKAVLTQLPGQLLLLLLLVANGKSIPTKGIHCATSAVLSACR